MSSLPTMMRPWIVGILVAQVVALGPAIDAVRAADHLTEHLRTDRGGCGDHASPALQGPCDPDGPCRNQSHDHHRHGRARDEALPCPSCVRAAAGSAMVGIGPALDGIAEGRTLSGPVASAPTPAVAYERPACRAPPTLL